MQVAVFFLTALLCLLVWLYAWQKTLRDETRDILFHMRQELRSTFLRHGLPLDNEAYLGMRHIINQHLRHVDKISFGSFLCFTIVRSKIPEFRALLDEGYNKEMEKVHTGLEDLDKAISEFRSLAAFALFRHMVLRNFLLALLSSIVWIMALIFKFGGFDTRSFKSSFNPTRMECYSAGG